MRRLPILLLAVLPLATPAAAKEAGGGEICGSDGCNDLGALRAGAEGGRPADPPTGAEPYFVLRLRFHGEERPILVKYRFLPRSGLLTGDGVSWSRPLAVDALRRAARGLKTFPADEAVPGGMADPPSGAVSAGAPPGDGTPGGGLGAWWAAIAAAPLALAAALLGARWRRHRRPSAQPT